MDIDPYVVVVTGDRNWTNRESVFREFSKLPPNTVIVHGGCRGLDTIAGEVAIGFGFSVDVHEAKWDLYGKAAGPIRNQEMLDLKPKKVLAFHPNLESSRGTKDCVREAMRRDIPVEIINV
jgi:hypothetical protein